MLTKQKIFFRRRRVTWCGAAGRARFRDGGNIPLIGLITHGFVVGNEKLNVESGTINYGYASRDPVSAEEQIDANERKQSLLDQNHSHFILVSLNAACRQSFHTTNVLRCPVYAAG